MGTLRGQGLRSHMDFSRPWGVLPCTLQNPTKRGGGGCRGNKSQESLFEVPCRRHKNLGEGGRGVQKEGRGSGAFSGPKSSRPWANGAVVAQKCGGKCDKMHTIRMASIPRPQKASELAILDLGSTNGHRYSVCMAPPPPLDPPSGPAFGLMSPEPWCRWEGVLRKGFERTPPLPPSPPTPQKA